MSSEPVLKVWALNKGFKKTNLPTCLSTISISNARRQFPVCYNFHGPGAFRFGSTDEITRYLRSLLQVICPKSLLDLRTALW